VATPAPQKLKKSGDAPDPVLKLAPNPDILATLARHPRLRPRLVVGFAAETEDLAGHARAKLAKKGCDWILANDVSPGTGTFGGDANTVHVVDAAGIEPWPRLTKDEVARRLAARVAAALGRS
jgi:phosphopantothenoylcysteine decarboxylase/phosphopantothenate--cysteine ligase